MSVFYLDSSICSVPFDTGLLVLRLSSLWLSHYHVTVRNSYFQLATSSGTSALQQTLQHLSLYCVEHSLHVKPSMPCFILTKSLRVPTLLTRDSFFAWKMQLCDVSDDVPTHTCWIRPSRPLQWTLWWSHAHPQQRVSLQSWNCCRMSGSVQWSW